MEIIQTAIKKGFLALSEHESKAVLSHYGIPTTREILVQECRAAVTAAETLGYPVVIKACAAHLMHKSEKNAIRMNLSGPDLVRKAYESIMETIDGQIDGILVQETIQGQRELIMGMTRDPQFGACIMLGMGGIATEIYKDSVFRVAPFDPREAADMTRELKAAAMLGPFRGQTQADMDTLCNCLMALAAIALEHPEISEIDINPLIIDPRGQVTAVDALVLLGTNQHDTFIH